MNIFRQHPAQSAAALLFIIFITAIILIQSYIATERQRDLSNWQSRLGIIADMHKHSLEKLLRHQQQQLLDLSQTATLQLYLSQLQSSAKNNDIVRAQATYVRNLIQAAAQRMQLSNARVGQSNSEFKRRSSYGLAILDTASKRLFSSRHFNSDLSALQALIDKALSSTQSQFVELQADAQQNAIYGFITPIFPIQKLQSSQAVGVIIAIFNPYNSLFKQLENPHLSTRSDETLLLSQQAEQVVYVSPPQAPAQIFHRVPATSKTLTASLAMQATGALDISQDYRGIEVLATSRKINHTPWVLLQKIDAAEALKESDEHQQFLITTFTLAILFLSVLLIAAWRHSSSIRLQKLSNTLEARTTLLNAVSDNINEHIFLLDEQKQFVFANQSLLQSLKLSLEEVLGKHINSILGADNTNRLLQCQLDSKPNNCITSLQLSGQDNSYHIAIIKLSSGHYENHSLYVLHDISQIQEMQEKRERLSRGIINTLVKATDLHDPFCANHSERTREVAIEIARAMALDDKQIQALEMAALLANIGKLFVPQDILTKMQPLSEAENSELRKHIHYAIDILKQLDFEGPVVKIIAQKNEHLDGSGYPAGLKGDELLLESKILAVANAFVAMSSSRAYRQGRAIDEVLDTLLQQADTQFDRGIIAALFHIAENKSNWRSWQSIAEN